MVEYGGGGNKVQIRVDLEVYLVRPMILHVYID